MEEPDAADQMVTEALRVGLTVGGRLGEQLAVMHQERLRKAEASSLQEARELQSRFDAERLAARAQLAVVQRDDWWESAQVEEIVAQWQTATTWRPLDEVADAAALRIEQEVRDRYNMDVNAPGADPRQVQERLVRIRDAREAAEEEERKARRDEAEAAEIILIANRLESDRDAGLVDDVAADEAMEAELRKDAANLMNSADRHRSAGERYSSIQDAETRQAVEVSERSQPVPIADAIAGGPAKAPKARKMRKQAATDKSLVR